MSDETRRPADDRRRQADDTRRPTWLEGEEEKPSRQDKPQTDERPEPSDRPAPEGEPPHLERGSPHDDEPAPYEPPGRDVP